RCTSGSRTKRFPSACPTTRSRSVSTSPIPTATASRSTTSSRGASGTASGRSRRKARRAASPGRGTRRSRPRRPSCRRSRRPQGPRAGPALVNGIADLLGAIRRGDATTVGDLLAAGPDLANARDERGTSPLLTAPSPGKHDIAPPLLERGARASFFEACAIGLVDDVRRKLRDDPGLVGQWSHDGWPPLHLAAFFGHREANLAINAAAAGSCDDRRPEIVRLLIERGPPVDGRGSPTGHTPLHEAAFNGDLALVRLLLDEAPTGRSERPRATRRSTSRRSTNEPRSSACSAGDPDQESVHVQE